jgi:hypothetical protein
MSIADDFLNGAGLASVQLHQVILQSLVLHKIIPREMALDLLDGALLVVETMQANAAAQQQTSLESAARGARLHIDSLRNNLEKRLLLPPSDP